MSAKEAGYNRIFAGINVDNIRYNIMKMRSLVKPDMKVLVVIKADAYGHGSVELAKRIGDLSDYYGVATIDEAVELREAGIDKPILIIGYTDYEDYDRVIAYNITQTVFDVEEAKRLSARALAQNKRVKVHIKVDTGMSRIGFPVSGIQGIQGVQRVQGVQDLQGSQSPRNMQELADSEPGIADALELKNLKGLEIEGIFTHYAKADERDKTYACEQKRKFLYFIDALEQRGMTFALKHIDNSAGTMEMQDDEFDMVRLGIVTYGLYPSEEIDRSVVIKPAMSLIAHIAYVKTVPSGTGIGYGWSYVTDKETRVATVTAGYADGYPRAQSNLGRVIIRGRYAPVIGRVCMDQIMVDVTDIPEAAVRDEVILIGTDGENNISVEEVAAPAASFNYELVCNIGRRVPRVYYEEGRDTICVNYLL